MTFEWNNSIQTSQERVGGAEAFEDEGPDLVDEFLAGHAAAFRVTAVGGDLPRSPFQAEELSRLWFINLDTPRVC
ncbi:MAG: hypothetical protein GXP36_02980 [Actinobacteria bacterium]|nr:hypothetical protein [Actinomycetota bacterium]